MTVSIWMRKNDVNVFNITKGLHVGFWFRDPGQDDVHSQEAGWAL